MESAKKITVEEFKNLPVVNGYKICPGNTDYSAISKFDLGCKFGPNCKFGRNCNFDLGCKFGLDCKFGSYCKFDLGCKFGRNCNFGLGCNFGRNCNFDSYCKFGLDCKFGSYCKFDLGCKFGRNCNFGSDCKFDSDCKFENLGEYQGEYPFISVKGFGSRLGSETYFFNLQKGIYVRCGCFIGKISKFRESVIKKYDKHHAYIGMCDLVEKQFLLDNRNK